MKVLVACEFSGVVRDAFRARGHDAVSCDLIDSETPGPHIKGDVREVLFDGWDMLIAFPPCTHLCRAGARWWSGREKEQAEAVSFATLLYGCGIGMVCLENPIGILSRMIGRPSQIIQPWQFGHPETKATCLWLRGLPRLTPTAVVEGREPRVHFEPPGDDRWKRRSRTLPGIAAAMAEQWSPLGRWCDPEPQTAATAAGA